MQYKEYLKSTYWKNRRNEFIKETWNRCYLCRTKNTQLDVHHKRYSRNGESILFNEKHTDLRLLCRRCHYAVHELMLVEILAKNLMKRRDIRDLILKHRIKGV